MGGPGGGIFGPCQLQIGQGLDRGIIFDQFGQHPGEVFSGIGLAAEGIEGPQVLFNRPGLFRIGVEEIEPLQVAAEVIHQQVLHRVPARFAEADMEAGLSQFDRPVEDIGFGHSGDVRRQGSGRCGGHAVGLAQQPHGGKDRVGGGVGQIVHGLGKDQGVGRQGDAGVSHPGVEHEAAVDPRVGQKDGAGDLSGGAGHQMVFEGFGLAGRQGVEGFDFGFALRRPGPGQASGVETQLKQVGRCGGGVGDGDKQGIGLPLPHHIGMGQGHAEGGVFDLDGAGGFAGQGHRFSEGGNEKIPRDVEIDDVGPFPKAFHQKLGLVGAAGNDGVGSGLVLKWKVFLSAVGLGLGNPQGIVSGDHFIRPQGEMNGGPGVFQHQSRPLRGHVGGLKDDAEKLV